MTERHPGSSPNKFEKEQPETTDRSDAEGRIEELRQRGGFFVDAVRATRMPMVLTDPNLPGNPIVFANASFLKLSGYDMEEVLGQQPFFMNGPETDAQDAARFREALEQDRDEQVETVQYRRDGSRFVANLFLSAFKDDDGRTVHHFLSWADVTRRVAAESDAEKLRKANRALRESEARLRSAFSLETVAAVFWGPDFRLKEVNDAFLRKTGYSRDEAVGMGWQLFTPPEFHETSQRAIDELEATGEAAPYEKQYYRKDGSRWWGLFAARRADEDILEIVIDISARKEVEEALRNSEQRYRLIVENARDYAIFTADREGRIDQWYEGAAEIFGWTAEEIAGELTDITFTPEDRERGAPARERETAAKEGRAPNVRWHMRKDGSLVFIDGIATALRDSEGALIGYLKIGQDVTERQAAVERQKTLLAELQHRVRNTLGIVRSIARRTAQTSDTVEEMAMHLEGRLAAFSRVQTMVTRHAEAGVDLTALIEDELLAHAAHEGEALSIHGPDLVLQPRAAETMSLAIHELTTNAVKYGALSAEHGRLRISWARFRTGGGEMLDLVWEENGVDMPAEPPERQGFGMELLMRTLPYDLRATTEVRFRREGVRFTMKVPLGPDVVAA